MNNLVNNISKSTKVVFPSTHLVSKTVKKIKQFSMKNLGLYLSWHILEAN